MTDVEKFANRQIKKISEQQKRSRRRYLILAYITSFLNLIVIALAGVAIELLIDDSNGFDVDLKLIMASLAAGTTIIIFVLNIVNIVYRSTMRWRLYREAIEEIEYLVGRHIFGVKNKNKISAKQLKDSTEKIFNKVMNTKRKISLMKASLKALSGGENA